MTEFPLRKVALVAGCLVIAAGIFIPAGVLAQTATKNPKLEALIGLASKETEVVYQSPDPETGLPTAELLRDMAALTEKLYGVKIRMKIDNALNFPASVAKAITEIKSGAPPSYDLMFQNAVSGLALLQNEAYEKISWLELFPDLKPQDLAWNGVTPIVDTQFMVPIYNSRLLKPQDAPQRWNDLLDLRWKGKLGVLVNNEPWNLLAQPNSWGRAATVDYLRKLMALSPKIGRIPESHQRVLSGETPLAVFGQLERTAFYRDQRNAPLGIVESVDPALTYVYIFVVPKNARNKNAATLIASAMMTKEGQELHQKYRNSTSMFRPGTQSAAFAQKHTVVIPDVDFMLSAEYGEINKEITALLQGR